VKRFSGENCSKNKELEQLIELSETKNALERLPKSGNRFSEKNAAKTKNESCSLSLKQNKKCSG